MCGISGIITSSIHDEDETSPSVSYQIYRALLTLQHRGQDSAGILTFDDVSGKFHLEKRKGLIGSVFSKSLLDKLKGSMGVGHNRYVTMGSDDVTNLQPVVTGLPFGIGLVHNGNILNYHSLRESLRKETGCQILSNNDVELILNLWCKYMMENSCTKFDFESATNSLFKVMNQIKGAYSVVGIVAGHGLFAFRDPLGIRPLVLGKKVENGTTSWCVASESVSLDFLQFEFVREILPGEFILIDQKGKIQNKQIIDKDKHARCMFEWVYFSGVEGIVGGKSVYRVRLALGELLGKKVQKMINQKKCILPDVVVPVPDTSRTAAISLSETLNLPYREALIKNRYVHRSFILNTQEKREKAIELKLNPVRSEIKNKNILLVDDSIVRGTTSKKIINLLKRYGAKSVSLASTCPPLRFPCYYGIDFPSSDELIASRKNIDEISRCIDANNVFYIDECDLIEAIGSDQLCMACLNDHYPTDINEGLEFSKIRLTEKKEGL